MPLRSCASPLCSGVVWVLNGSWFLLLERGAVAAFLSPVLHGVLLCRSLPCVPSPQLMVAPCNPLCLSCNNGKPLASKKPHLLSFDLKELTSASSVLEAMAAT